MAIEFGTSVKGYQELLQLDDGNTLFTLGNQGSTADTDGRLGWLSLRSVPTGTNRQEVIGKSVWYGGAVLVDLKVLYPCYAVMYWTKEGISWVAISS